MGNTNEYTCVTNYLDFTPFPYENEDDLKKYLTHPGALDVSSRYRTVMLFGFIANVLFICHMVVDRKLSKETQLAYGFSRTLLNMIVNATWMVQFWMMIIYRWSHGGAVCAGDYSAYYPYDENSKGGYNYNKYYLPTEG